ncbi:glycosyltransferase [Verrucomicrobiota bacterium sgz303538]
MKNSLLSDGKLRKVAFVSTNVCAPWGGSEVLWSEAARRLATTGHIAVASVHGWPKSASALAELRKAGVPVHERWKAVSKLRPRVLQKIAGTLARRASPHVLGTWLDRGRADLVCVSVGSPADDISLMDACTARSIPYVTVFQANAECVWPDDARAQRLIEIVAGARRNFFVSRENHSLLETQLGIAVPNSEVIRNPYNVRRDVEIAWPHESTPLKLACVARLDPSAKGQDLLLHVLASEPWRSRSVSVSFYGNGRSQQGLCRLAQRLQVEDRAQFFGHVEDIESVWATHHALVLPSRYEGLPLAVVEAMLCGRPSIVTDVAGNAEVVEDGVTGFIAEAASAQHLHRAMERAWENRSRWREIGMAAASAIRAMVPPDPAADFARRLLELIDD